MTSTGDYYTPGQLMAMNIVSLSLGGASIGSAALAFYWFLTMRRGFRHDLIMLLIQSDMVKSVWFAAYPIVSFIDGPISSSSPFCQASGFFLSLGIEASDLAVLLIALHAGLNIFRPRHVGGELGLFPYRRIAYLAWSLIPAALAGLAFANRPLGYESDGRLCYLPSRPQWPGLALSWIPRYLIFAIILFTYGYIYLYVSVLIRRFGAFRADHSHDRLSARPLDHPPDHPPDRPPDHPQGLLRGTWRQGRLLRVGSVPPVPPIEYHGLVTPTPPSRRTSATLEGSGGRRSSHQGSGLGRRETDFELGPGAVWRSATARSGPGDRDRRWSSVVRWKWPHFGVDIPAVLPSPHLQRLATNPDVSQPLPSVRGSRNTSPHLGDSDDDQIPPDGGLAVPARSHQPAGPRRRASAPDAFASPGQNTDASSPFWHRPVSLPGGTGLMDSPENHAVDLTAILRRGPRRSRESDPSTSIPSPRRRSASSSSSTSSQGSASSDSRVYLSPVSCDVSDLAKKRDKIRRQLRLMFVYPLAYVLIWVAPLIAHTLKWNNHSEGMPFAISLLSLASLSAQGAVNSWLFSTREQPWKHKAASRRSSGTDSAAMTDGPRSRKPSRLGEWGWPGTLEIRRESGQGRSWEESQTEERGARLRRLDEEFEEQNLGLGKRPERPSVREWWDVEESRITAEVDKIGDGDIYEDQEPDTEAAEAGYDGEEGEERGEGRVGPRGRAEEGGGAEGGNRASK